MCIDLLHDPWIPIRHLTGPAAPESVSLLDTYRLGGALDLAEYGLWLPALVRQVLTPAVMDAVGTPASAAEWLDLWDRREGLYPVLEEYLLEYGAWFTAGAGRTYGAWCVWDADRPSQVWDLASLMPELPTGSSVPLSHWQVAGDHRFTWPQLVRGALLTQCWDHASPKARVPGCVASSAGTVSVLGRAQSVMPVGRTLLDTMFLNVPIVPDGIADDDLPPWRRDLSITGEDRGPRGVMELLTWQSRRIAMYMDADGVPEACAITAGDRYRGASPIDPHVAWTTNAKGEPTPRQVEPTTPTWQGLPALLTPGGHSETGGAPPQLATLAETMAEEYPEYPLRLHLSGVQYGSQSACIDYVTTDTVPLNLALLRADPSCRATLDEAIGATAVARDAVGRMAWAVAQVKAVDTSSNSTAQLRKYKARWQGRLDQALTPTFSQFLGSISEPDAPPRWAADVQQAASDIIDELVSPIPMQEYLRHGIARSEGRQRAALSELNPAR